MQLVVNGTPMDWPGSAPTLLEVLDHLQLEPERRNGLAIAVNEHLVRRADWPHRLLQALDRIELVQAHPGG